LLQETVLGLDQLLSFALELGAADDLGQVNFEQASLLPLKLRQRGPQSALTVLERLGQPFASLRTPQLVCNQGGVGEQTAQILPDELIQGLGRRVAGGAALALGGPQRIGAAAADVIRIARMGQPAGAGQETLATTD